MHDPDTVAFTIPYPWREAPSKHFPKGYRHPFITIWHRDPEKRGSDDSCDWFGRRRPLNQREPALYEALDNLLHTLGNRPFYPDARLYGADYLEIDTSDGGDKGPVGELERAMYRWRARRRFRWHPRWHIHHWRLQVHPLQLFKRWAFTRCRLCGGRFAWGETGMGTWSGTGPRWFRSENLTHMRCDDASRRAPVPAVDPSWSTPTERDP